LKNFVLVSKEYVQAHKFSKAIVTTAWGVMVEWV